MENTSRPISDVQVIPEWHYGKQSHYSVWADGEKIDEFTSYGWLTAGQLYDVASLYSSALDGRLQP